MPAIAHTSENPRIWVGVPARNPNFTGREAMLGRLHDELNQAKRGVTPHSLYGMGGVGKTQIVIEYVHRFHEEYDLIWWIPSEHSAEITASLTELAARLGIPEAPEAEGRLSSLREALSTGILPYRRWLLIFDNADNLGEVRRFFPTGGNGGDIVVTSRNPEWARVATALEVDVFTRIESRQFLTTSSPEVSGEDADRLAGELGDLPLALEQAAAWRVEAGMSVDEYLRLPKDKRIELLGEWSSPDYPESVGSTWSASLDRLARDNPDAFQLLQLCAFLPAASFRLEALGVALDRGIADRLGPILRDPVRLGLAIRDIHRYSLAKVHDGTVQMHRLVQCVLRHRMDNEQRRLMQAGVQTLLASRRPLGDEPSARAPVGTIVVLTALNLEFQALHAYMRTPEASLRPGGMIFEIGRLTTSDIQVALAVVGSGTLGAAALAEQAIAEFQPIGLLVMGVAGALNQDLMLGDLVVATKVYGYQGAKHEGRRTKARPEAWAAPLRLEQLARQVALDDTWRTLIPGAGSRAKNPAVHFGPVASGDVVLNSTTAALPRQLDGSYNDALAIEMESSGIAKAAQLRNVPSLTIRGISDKADGRKRAADRSGWQRVAAANAAAFVAALIGRIGR